MALEEFRSSSDVRTGVVQGNTFSSRRVQYSVIDGQAIFEGDIVLGTVEDMERPAEDMERPAVDGIPEAAAILIGAQFRWPGGIVPFTIDPALPNVARVNDAIAHWHNRTHIRLVARTTEKNFVTFTPGGGCSSSVGMRGGQQFITLAPGCDRGRTIHEIGHAVGLWHEQSREDRDQFIRIHFENIEPGQEHNFNQHITDGDDIGPYDFGSIMHYEAFAFSRNNQPTIETLHGEAIGQRNGLSDGDVQAINFMYPIIGWNSEFFPIPGQHTFDRERQQIAAVSRTPNNLDLFVIGFDNHVWTNFWPDATGRWNNEWFPIPGQHTFDRERQQIAAVSRTPNNLDLFVIGFDNHVWTNFWPDATGRWNNEWFPIPGQHTFDRERQQIAAVSRTPNNLDLFVIGFDNHVWTNFWPDATGRWNNEWFPIPGQHTFDRERQQIAAVSRTPNNLDLFVIGFDNHVWTNFWPDATGRWNNEWFPIPGQHTFDRERQQIAAVSRTPNNLDLFVIGFDNHVWTTFWNGATGWNSEWFPIPGQHTFDHERQQIAAVARSANNLDLFVIGFDNHVWTNFWPDAAGHWNSEWFPIPGQHTFDRERQQIAAVSRTPNNLDLFVIGFDNHVWSNFWTGR